MRSSNCNMYQARIVYSTLLQSFKNSARSELCSAGCTGQQNPMINMIQDSIVKWRLKTKIFFVSNKLKMHCLPFVFEGFWWGKENVWQRKIKSKKQRGKQQGGGRCWMCWRMRDDWIGFSVIFLDLEENEFSKTTRVPKIVFPSIFFSVPHQNSYTKQGVGEKMFFKRQRCR